jgi:hypothetical protein
MRNAGCTVCEKDLETPLRFNLVSLISARTTLAPTSTGAQRSILFKHRTNLIVWHLQPWYTCRHSTRQSTLTFPLGSCRCMQVKKDFSPNGLIMVECIDVEPETESRRSGE